MEIREARQEDNAALREASSRIEIGNPNIRLFRVIRNDFFAKAKYHSHAKVLAAWDDGRIAGSAACSIREGVLDGAPKRVGYLFQLFVSPDFRRQGVARILIQRLEDYLNKQDVDLCFLAVAEENKPAMTLFQNSGYELYRMLLNPGFAVSQERESPQSANIRTCSTEDLEPVSQLINQTWSGHDLYEPLSAESLTRCIDRMQGAGLENLLVLEDRGKIQACLGYWDASDNVHLLIKSVSVKMRMLGILGRFLPSSGALPRMPKPGQTIKPALPIGFIGYRDFSAFSALFHHVSTLARRKGLGLIFFICEEENPIAKTMDGFFRFNSHINIYTKALKPEARLNGRPVFADTFEII